MHVYSNYNIEVAVKISYDDNKLHITQSPRQSQLIATTSDFRGLKIFILKCFKIYFE